MRVASRYAKSLMELAIESNQQDAVRSDMKSIEKLCSESSEFVTFLESPVIKTDKKIGVLNSIFKGKVSEMTLAFLTLITNKRRESIIKEIATAYDDQYKLDKNIFTAIVTSANGLDKKSKEQVIDLIKTQMKGEVELIEKIDSNTIGGFVLKIGDQQIDKTVARQLINMKKHLTNKELN